MFTRDRSKFIREHQIEELLLNAQIEQEIGLDLIEEYFKGPASLDEITKHAKTLIEKQTDPQVIEMIGKNFSECIVVKNQQEQKSLLGIARRLLASSGIVSMKSKELQRAEELFQQITKSLTK